jgi:hypothetical protein
VVEGTNEEEPNSAFVLGLQLDRYFPVEISRGTTTNWNTVVTNEDAFFSQMAEHIVNPLKVALGATQLGLPAPSKQQVWLQAYSLTNITLIVSVLAVTSAVAFIRISRSFKT